MTGKSDPMQARIDSYIDRNLQRVFSDLENDTMPDEILDLLTLLRSQDQKLTTPQSSR